MEDRHFIRGSWEDFESWIKAKVGGEFLWKVRPMDTEVNRMAVALSIVETMENNGGTFPWSGNIFLERETDETD